MCAHTAITGIEHHIRRGQEHKKGAGASFVIGLLNCPESGLADLVNGKAAQRCETPLTRFVSPDKIPIAIQQIF